MAKEKEILQKQLAKRKYKIPNKFIYFLYHLIFRWFVMPKYRPHLVGTDKVKDCKGPCFIIWNHLSRIDHGYIMALAYPRPISILAGYSEFFRSHLHTVFKLMNIVPKKIFAYDPGGIRAINSIIKQGGCLAFSPEGMASNYGINQPITPGTGHFIRHYKIPVYFVELKGLYLTSTKPCTEEKYGRTEAEMKLLFTPEQLESMTDEEIELKINEAFRHDDYKWGRENHIKWKHKGDMAKNLNQICYKCPRCGAEMKILSKDDKVVCEACGNGAEINDYYEFVPFDDKCVIPESPSIWVQNERQDIIREIRADNKYSISAHVKLGYIPEYHYIKNKATSEICGEGEITIDHKGVHFNGTKLGESFAFDLTYKSVFSLVIMTDCTKFALYVGNDFYEFFPDEPVVGKMLLVTEEMHRLHENQWKNFPWFDYMYENVPEYVPAEEEK